MWARPDGRRLLLAGTQEAAGYVSAAYGFDEVVVGPLRVQMDGRFLHLHAPSSGLVDRLGSFGIAVVLATHLLDDVARVCDHVVMLDGGRLVTDAPTESLLHQTGTVMVDVGPADAAALGAALTARGLAVATDDAGMLEVTINGDGDLDVIRDVIADLDLPLHKLTNRLTSLDDVFRRR